MGAVGIGATIYWGSEESTRQLQEVSQAFEFAHELGMVPFFGVIHETMHLKLMVWIIILPPILQGRQITSV